MPYLNEFVLVFIHIIASLVSVTSASGNKSRGGNAPNKFVPPQPLRTDAASLGYNYTNTRVADHHKGKSIEAAGKELRKLTEDYKNPVPPRSDPDALGYRSTGVRISGQERTGL